MPDKAYIILHDKNNLLIGKGGKSGKNKKERQGFHLPGGTIDANESATTTVIRELKEETGIRLGFHDQPYEFEMSLDGYNVTFVVISVSALSALIGKRKYQETKNKYDEPFRNVESVKLDSCWMNAEFQYQENIWFSKGLFKAKQSGYLNL